MAFVLAADGRDEDVVRAFRRYQEYLHSQSSRFPRSAFALATSDWYFNFDDHRCPHDAWLETLEICELDARDRGEQRSISLKVRLLGARHGGHIELRYPRVFAYTLDVSNGERGHCDWRYDELRVSNRGLLIHEIEWCGARATGNWVIEASDLEFRWVPAEVSEPNTSESSR